ncbi:unnamed protein product [Cyclocybe aegerita]|uniref:Extracellular metalloproteinase n=1 Tax=Cyclocybe aegerita TaxID=1973307 RepID=A0A8S0WU31_CYCAE|nr:unnamed protein product [Cyclocybe aegerita]
MTSLKWLVHHLPDFFPYSFGRAVLRLFHLHLTRVILAFAMSTSTLSSRFFSLFVSLALLSSVSAIPWPSTSKHATHRRRNIGGREVESFHPESTFKTFGSTGRSFAVNQQLFDVSIEGLAIAFFGSRGFDTSGIKYRSGYSAGEFQYAYLKQSANGIDFANAVANVVFKGDKVVSFGSSFVNFSSVRIPSATPSINLKDVLPKIQSEFNATKPDGSEPALEYLVQSNGSVVLAYVVQLRNSLIGAAFEVFVDAISGVVLSITDFVAHASYTVVPIDKASFADGLQTVTNPQDTQASPSGWHTINNKATTTTAGNNVVAFTLRNGTRDFQESPILTFMAKYDAAASPNTTDNTNAARANAFYVANRVHDIAYRYGFTEKAFNFQHDNFGKGGKGNDSVDVIVHDPSGLNNAYFSVPPDGEPGTCHMFIWTKSLPNRDGSMDNGILIHEMAHGITGRMTGGGTARCLQTTESGGLGEGWSDTFAGWMEQSSRETKDITIGSYVYNRTRGLRRFPYSVNTTTNPLRYSDLKKLTEVHYIGEVWANMLHNVYASLVQQFDYSSDRFTNPDSPAGNVVFLRLFIDSLAIQPCNPTFVQARNAWIQADVNRYGGKHRCTVFKAFASRGLGAKAGPQFDDDGTIPPDCS